MGVAKGFIRLKSFSSRFSSAFQGFVTIIAFTEKGRMRQFRLRKSLLVFTAFMMVVLMVGSFLSFLELLQSRYHLARLASLEVENRSLTSLLEDQATQLGKLRVELDRLKELEQALRAVAGFSSPQEPGVGGGQGDGRRFLGR